jgi:hypothetical protein
VGEGIEKKLNFLSLKKLLLLKLLQNNFILSKKAPLGLFYI